MEKPKLNSLPDFQCHDNGVILTAGNKTLPSECLHVRPGCSFIGFVWDVSKWLEVKMKEE